MAKRAAPSSSTAPSSKKAKPASKGTPKGKKTSNETTDSPLDKAKQVASDIINTVSEVVDNAGDLILDDGNTPAPVSKVIEENVDVLALKKKGKAAKAKAVEVAQDAEEKLEQAVEKKTGVDVKKTKAKAGKVVKDAQDQVESAVEATKPLKGKAAKAGKVAQDTAEAAVESVDKVVKDPKNRKKAEDFMHSAEETVKAVAGKVGEVLSNVVDQFGEASGLSADLGTDVEKGKKVAAKKGKQVVEAAEEKVEGGKKVAAKKGKQIKEVAEDKVEEGKKIAGKKGKQAQEAAEDVVEEGKKIAGKKGQQAKKVAEETVEEGKKIAGQKGKQAKEVVEETVQEGKKLAGKKGKQVTEAAEEVKETTKRKAKNAVDAAEPTTKKVKAAAEPIIEKGKKAIKDAEPAVTKGKKAAASAAGKATKAAADAMDIDEDDNEEYIHGFSSSDGEGDSDDESDDDDEDRAVAEAGKKVDMSTLPMVAKDDKSVQAKLKKASKKKDDPKGTLYLGRVPHGFYEEQMKEYFSQFGDVTRLRLARNRKTGASKHYAYIEFSSASVAEIVSETMNNYLLMGHLLKCHVIPEDKVHPQLWVGANKKFRKIPTARVEKQKHEKERNDEEKGKADKKLLKKEGARKRKIKESGIEYDYPGHVSFNSNSTSSYSILAFIIFSFASLNSNFPLPHLKHHPKEVMLGANG
ncbi:uncharacterized protein I206_102348 [Kwoniella pini CBS 10737]|uniref:RRM domain-containing protein n=1 Tax=Kwoniella pini CBS 10737 TaxID=1296096 RepID=A0A1B9I586_9TREE|nr:uncharacterized protein I206_02695 [Kwoniella pini CBS 10737]OCF50641.1 hypothetical protein I206_02695 [Kwoniella pini CBS 10737]